MSTGTEQARTFSGVDPIGVPDVLDPVASVMPTAGSKTTVLSELRDALAQEVHSEPVTLLVATREGIAVTFETGVTAEQIKAWRKRCKDRHSETGVDEVRFSATVLANQASGVSINEKEALGEDGEALTFRSPTLLDMLGAQSALGAVMNLYGSDAAVLASADEVLKAAGYGEEAVRAEDPTTRR